MYREIGYRKTTVADVARDASMSPANLYRFYASRSALEEAVVTELLEEVSAAAASAARTGRSGLERLNAVFWAISRIHEDRLANNVRLHELVVAAGQANWPASLSHADRLRGVGQSVIAAGQAGGEFRAARWRWPAACSMRWTHTSIRPASRRPPFGRPSTR
ncbi:AcrR family transcriptional regulator [Bradyrhizobium sp. RT9b]|uniref:TetR/AcrR family transcriptional regulator n=1 Tax=unclassified Bradyrhizobium TaxID=2631580 RepID=UPI00339158F6